MRQTLPAEPFGNIFMAFVISVALVLLCIVLKLHKSKERSIMCLCTLVSAIIIWALGFILLAAYGGLEGLGDWRTRGMTIALIAIFSIAGITLHLGIWLWLLGLRRAAKKVATDSQSPSLCTNNQNTQ